MRKSGQIILTLILSVGLIFNSIAQNNRDNVIPKSKKQNKDEYFIDFEAKPVCLGEIMTFQLRNADQLDSVYWKFNDPNADNDYSSESQPQYQFSSAGEFEVELEYFFDNATTSYKLKKKVLVIDNPKAGLPNDMSFCVGDSLEITTKYGDLFKYKWSTGSTDDHIVVNEPGLYSVNVTNECGIGQEWVLVKQSECKCNYYLPNTFTPNGDRLNDVFKAEYYCDIESFDIKIFDRWGKQLFASDSPDFRWTGENATFEGDAVYVYFIEMDIRENNVPHRKKLKGTITLLR